MSDFQLVKLNDWGKVFSIPESPLKNRQNILAKQNLEITPLTKVGCKLSGVLTFFFFFDRGKPF